MPRRASRTDLLRAELASTSSEDVHRRSRDLSGEMSRLRDVKPRPLHRMYGRSPTAEQVQGWKTSMAEWTRQYRQVSDDHKIALEVSNQRFHQDQAASAQAPRAPADLETDVRLIRLGETSSDLR